MANSCKIGRSNCCHCLRHKKKTGAKTKPKAAKIVEVPFVQPIPLLCHMSLTCPEFSNMLLKVLDEYAPSLERPLSLICYQDGVSPGNVLAHDQRRKVEVIYWSIKEFGDLALSSEKNWFVLSVARTCHVKRFPGKTSQFFRKAVERFFDPVDIRHGVQLVFPAGQRRMLFMDLAMVVADEVAMKDCISMKGASGTVLCPLSRNVVDWKSDLHLQSAELIPSNAATLEQVDLHTDESLMETLRFLAEKSRGDAISKTRFAKMEQSLGWNHVPEGFLHSDIVRCKPVSCIQWDWMHVYCVGGLFNQEAGLLIAKLSGAGVSQADLDEHFNRFRWPQSLSSRGVTGVNLFAKGDQECPLACSASECLSAYSVLRFVVLQYLQQGGLQAMKAECTSYFLLCRVMDLLMHQKKHGWDPASLRGAVQEHLQAYSKISKAYNRFLPKHHYSLHLAEQCAHHGTLVSCWVHERKHREIKRHANLICNTWGRFERSVVVDAWICW